MEKWIARKKRRRDARHVRRRARRRTSEFVYAGGKGGGRDTREEETSSGDTSGSKHGRRDADQPATTIPGSPGGREGARRGRPGLGEEGTRCLHSFFFSLFFNSSLNLHSHSTFPPPHKNESLGGNPRSLGEEERGLRKSTARRCVVWRNRGVRGAVVATVERREEEREKERRRKKESERERKEFTYSTKRPRSVR